MCSPVVGAAGLSKVVVGAYAQKHKDAHMVSVTLIKAISESG